MDLHSYHHHQIVSTHCVSPRAQTHPEFCVKHLHLTVTRGDAVEEVRPECRCTEGVSTMFPLALPGSNIGARCHCPLGCALSHLHEGGFPTPLLLALPHLRVFPGELALTPSPPHPRSHSCSCAAGSSGCPLPKLQNGAPNCWQFLVCPPAVLLPPQGIHVVSSPGEQADPSALQKRYGA